MHLKLKSIERRKTAFGTKLIYLAYIKNFYLAGQSSSSLRGKYCTICQKKIKYLADKDYYVLGTLSEDKHGRYQFMPAKDKSWLPVNYSFSLAQIRYELKSNFKLFLENSIKYLP